LRYLQVGTRERSEIVGQLRSGDRAKEIF